MALTKKDLTDVGVVVRKLLKDELDERNYLSLAVLQVELQERDYVTSPDLTTAKSDILSAVDAYKKLVKNYELELTSLRGKCGRLARVLKRVARKVNVKTPEL